jgi:membrane protein YqaA with SNARE-associated domain
MRWLKLGAVFAAVVGISFALAFGTQRLVDWLNIPLDRYAWLAYLFVFGISFFANLTVLAPVPIAVSVMVAVGAEWNPVLSALAAAAGGTFGELSGYYAGYAGRKIAVSERFAIYNRFESWIQRYGAWAIALIAFQPIIPFDVGGIIAGAVRMSLCKFLLANFLGKFPKYTIMAFIGVGLIHFIPFFSP